jgi:H+/Cl- antiporter ClcA
MPKEYVQVFDSVLVSITKMSTLIVGVLESTYIGCVGMMFSRVSAIFEKVSHSQKIRWPVGPAYLLLLFGR